jgi:predicted RNA-binding Zn ribbon-like protein
METMPVTDLRLVGGNTALDFLNTQGGPPGDAANSEALGEYGDVLAWTRVARVLSPQVLDRLVSEASRNPAAGAIAFQQALTARTYLYELFEALATQKQVPEDTLRSLQSDEARAIRAAELRVGGGNYSWCWDSSSDLEVPLWTIVHAATLLLTTGPTARIKRCAGCRFLFLDQSKNGSRRWCSMDDCGAAEKMSRYVARRSASRTDARTGEPET